MAGCIVQVMLSDYGRAPWEPQQAYVQIETEFSDFAEVCAALDAGQLVSGALLRTRPGQQSGERIVTGRRPVAITKAAVARIFVPDVRFVEEAA